MDSHTTPQARLSCPLRGQPYKVLSQFGEEMSTLHSTGGGSFDSEVAKGLSCVLSAVLGHNVLKHEFGLIV